MKKTLIPVERGFALFGLAIVQVLVWAWVVVALSLLIIGVGVFLVPEAVMKQRRLAELSRKLAGKWNGVEIPSPYLPEPAYSKGFIGQAERTRTLLSDPATWRDLLWGVTDPIVGALLASFAAILPLYGIEGVLMPLIREATAGQFNDWYAGIPVGQAYSPATAWLCVPAGIAIFALSRVYSPRLLHVHGLWTRLLLSPGSETVLTQRIKQLTLTRADAVDNSAAELRRIERDLHDGAQARLVAMGMSLGAIEHLLEKDPEKAKVLLAEARATSAKALNELRDLVRGIHPPVLADRGLSDAIRALALDSGLNVDVQGTVPRLAPPIESAAYFAVSEVLTNAAKHADPDRVWIDLRHEDGMLRIGVTDDGLGGASFAGGTGLRGIERRLATFDGVLALNSPPGGPTLVTLELPC
jgi:signal transduction histidine kinase